MTERLDSLQTTSREELRQLVSEQLQSMLEQENWQGVKSLLVPVQPIDVAEAIEALPESWQAIAFRLLPKGKAIEVYENLDTSVQQGLIQEFKRQEVIDLVERMSPDDRVKLFDELPAKVVRRLLSQLSAQERQATAQLLGYPEDTAGRLMTPEYISLKDTWTVAQSLERIRNLASASETVYSLYVTDAARQLSGIVSLRDLVLADPETPVGDIVTRDLVSVQTDTDQEEAARLIQRYDLLALPVVDREQRLVGVITVDDVIDVLEQETTEDIYTLGGVQSAGDSYFQTHPGAAAGKRVVWLLALLLTNSLTSQIIQSQQAVLQQVVGLAAFIPLLIGTGGNVGAQSSTVVIRGINTDEVRDLGPLQVVAREILVGALLGTMLGALALGWAFWLQNELPVAVSVGASLFAIAILASGAGSALPFLFRAIGLDPALMSAPFITTAVDVLGVLIYFYLARLILGL
ncbi:MAG: magnesium transporter [Cyanobacteria bacterium QS_8_64_29]|nr:MAG: magnesium transporter [Cyanobacteria bacterium QS_8_64_29]